MGILNVTPDSFSDGGLYLDERSAIRRGIEMAAEGADILDVGGESTRPGSLSIDAGEEMRRVLPVIKELSHATCALISVDTVKPEVARAALAAGAGMVNDVSNLRDGVELAETVAEADACLVLMHSRGTPENMQEKALYGDLLREVGDDLMAGVERAKRGGVRRENIWIDPGIGFAKTAEQNVAILRNLSDLVALGYPVMVGPSRKSFIGKLTGAEVNDRLGGTAAAVTAAVINGAAGVRVHDVAVMRQACIIASAVAAGRLGREISKEAVHA